MWKASGTTNNVASESGTGGLSTVVLSKNNDERDKDANRLDFFFYIFQEQLKQLKHKSFYCDREILFGK